MTQPQCLAILGPTCCWKSQAALLLAQQLQAEIISCDSMQIYRHLSIGTAKVTEQERRLVPHHLVDELELDQPYDANRFVARANAALEDIAARGRTAILVGGTGLYARALIYGFNMLPAQPEVFRRLEDECRAPGGRERLLAQLEQAAQAAGTTTPDDCKLNPRRLVRACEVLELTGQVPWLLQQKNDHPDPRFVQFCLVPPLNAIRERIRLRTRLMLEHGWLQEAEQADRLGLLQTPTARQALGYADVISYCRQPLPKSLDTLAETIANKTIQYARRQLTWFKHQHPGAIRLDPAPHDNPTEWIVDQIRQHCQL